MHRSEAIQDGFAFGYRYALQTGEPYAPAAVLALHKTGESEHEALDRTHSIFPDCPIVAPRGDRLEEGRHRYFGRHADGSFDVVDWRRSSAALAAFIRAFWTSRAFRAAMLFGVSHGANAGLGAWIFDPALFVGAVLLRPAPPPHGYELPGLPEGVHILVASGDTDRVVPKSAASELVTSLKIAGARVDHLIQSAGHELVPGDADAIRSWLRRQEPLGRPPGGYGGEASK